jgi:hypothetical protein
MPRIERSLGVTGRVRACDARRSALRADTLRCSDARPGRPTRCVRCAHSAQTSGGQSVHEARCARRPHILRFSAPSHASLHAPRRTESRYRRRPATNSATVTARRAVPLPGPVGGGEKRRTGVGAHSALRELTWRRLSERSERSERSELGATTPVRASQRSRRMAATATVWAWQRHGPPRLSRGSAIQPSNARLNTPFISSSRNPRAIPRMRSTKAAQAGDSVSIWSSRLTMPRT